MRESGEISAALRPLRAGRTILRMKLQALALTMAGICAFGSHACCQTESPKPIETTSCDIATNPEQFYGKLVRLRAQIWPDLDHTSEGMFARSWLFGLSPAQRPDGQPCRFLAGKFAIANNLVGRTYWGTFTGRVVRSERGMNQDWPVRSGFNAVLVIESQSDINGSRNYANGPVQNPRVYDPQSGTFVVPE